MSKLTTGITAVILTLSTMISTSVFAEVSFNIGWASEYHFRGVFQKNSSASAGADFESSGFYAGTWAADVGEGLEIDGYFGYGIETETGFKTSVSFAGYYYTGDFDDTYKEIIFDLGYGPISFEYAVGTFDNFNGPKQDYDFAGLTLESDTGFYGTYGISGKAFDGDYIEIGYSQTFEILELGVAAIFSSKELANEVDASGAAIRSDSLTFSIGKTF